MITVPLGERTYPVHIGSGLLDCLGSHVLEMHGEISVAVVTDDNVAPLYLDRAVKSLENAGLRVCTIVLPHGEQTITTNNFDGQFCLHFYGSKTHGTDKVDSDHQSCVAQAMKATW